MGSINPLPPMAAGHRSSNPTRERGSRGVILHCMSQRPQCLSHNPTCLSCCASRAMLGRVRTLPPLRFGLLADAPMTAGHRPSNPTRKRGSTGVMLNYIDTVNNAFRTILPAHHAVRHVRCLAVYGRSLPYGSGYWLMRQWPHLAIHPLYQFSSARLRRAFGIRTAPA
jgi:hypothetical protein